jgi:MFS family permease
MKQEVTKKFWAALVIFSLMGQVAWVIENMYFNVFIYKMFHASAADISLMVGASSVVATLTTIFMGAFIDYTGKRKPFICGGYLAWGLSILAFAGVRMDVLTPFTGSTLQAASLGVTVVIILDCVMTFLGSTANDASFNAWMTDWGNGNNRGKIEGLNAMMPLLAILVVFGGFMMFDLEDSTSWTLIYLIVGIAVMIIGVLGFVLIDDQPHLIPQKENYWKKLSYSFRWSVLKENRLLYAVIGAFAIFGISINIFMPYLILYYEKTLGMTNYVLIMAPAIVLAAIFTAYYGKLFDLLGFKMSVVPTVILLMLGYVFLYFGKTTGVVFLGSLLMMSGYLGGMAIFGAMIKSHIPPKKSGQFQGVRMIGQVFLPGIIGPALGAWVLRNAEQIVNSDGTTSFLPNRSIYAMAFIVAVILLIALYAIFWMMEHGHYTLMSEAGENFNEKIPFSDYPRPQLKRDNFYILNGEWMLNDKAICVPFPPQSVLSHYQGKVGKFLTYTKTFNLKAWRKSLPPKTPCDRLMLHFGAVDQIAEVWLNDKYLGKHEGGYLPFSFEVTQAIKEDGDNQLVVKVTDTLSKDYPYGKQAKKRGGMWYTPVSGIWQSVWLEYVPQEAITQIKITPDLNQVVIEVCTNQPESEQEMIFDLQLHDGTIFTLRQKARTFRLDLTQLHTANGKVYRPKRWTLEDPYLYQFTLTIGDDKIASYFALRTIEIQNKSGLPRVCLNGEPVFLHGVLDQGYFCDGIYLPATEAEFERDILRMKNLGFNMLRKHIKIEPECFYYYCDKHGMLVMQDMVNNATYSWLRDTALPTIGVYLHQDGQFFVSKKQKNIFKAHMKETMTHLYNHPCIVAYTIFNEGWGQFESDKMYEMAKSLDATRLYDATSGWFPKNKSDFNSQHTYFKPLNIPEKLHVPLFISECGGYSYVEPHHYYSKYASYGYGVCKTREEFSQRVTELYKETIVAAIAQGLCGCIYTQLSDVEDEINGFYTYDRKVCKVETHAMQLISQSLQEAIKK